MQRRITILFAVMLTGCGVRTQEPIQVEVGFGGVYQNDLIVLFADGTQVYSNALTTREGTTGFTDSTQFKAEKRTFEFRIVAPARESTGEIDLNDGKHLCIMYADDRPYLHQSETAYQEKSQDSITKSSNTTSNTAPSAASEAVQD